MRTLLLGCVSVLVSVVACGGGGAPASTPAAPNGANATPAAAAKPPAPTAPASDKVTWKKDSPAKTCHVPNAGGDLVAAVTSIAKGCVGSSFHQVGTPVTGEGQEGTATMVKQLPLAAKANVCYRVFGLAEPTVTDFDIAVMDSAGKSAGEDLTDTNDSIVLEDGAVCFKQDDNVNVNVAVAQGRGKWAVEIWSN